MKSHRLYRYAAGAALAVGVSLGSASPMAHALLNAPAAESNAESNATAKITVFDESTRTENGVQASNCTGTLISSSWVLTAKHCFENDGKTGFVTFGVDDTGKKYQIGKVVGHPDADLALVQLKENVTDITPAKFWEPDASGKINPGGMSGDIYGWGWGGTNGLEPLKSLATGTGKLDDGFYSRADKPDGSTERMVMLKVDNARITQGDSGGPLYVDGKLFGVLSGRDQGSVDDPNNLVPNNGFYIPANLFGAWIQDTASVDVTPAKTDDGSTQPDNIEKPGSQPDSDANKPDDKGRDDNSDNSNKSGNSKNTGRTTSDSDSTSSDDSEEVTVEQGEDQSVVNGPAASTPNQPISTPSQSTPTPSVVTQSDSGYTVDEASEEDDVYGAKVNTGGSVDQGGFFQKLWSTVIG